MRYRFIVFCVVLMGRCTQAAPINPSSVIEQGEKQLRGETSQIQMRMMIRHAAYQRELMLRSWSVGKEKSLVVILEPPKENGISSLRLLNQMWNFFPNTDQTIRIPTSVMLQSWMGSDFTNDDLMKLSSLSADYDHQLLKELKYQNESVRLIQCTPKPKAPVVWGKILYWARTKDNLPMKEEYYDEKEKLIRTLLLSEFKLMDDRIIPTKLSIESAENPGESTTITYEKALYDRKIPDSQFERGRLREISQNAKNKNQAWLDLP